MDRFKYPRKEAKMDRATEDVAVPLTPKIIEHYKDIHLNIDILFINQKSFLLVISRDIGCIHCRPMSNNVTKQIKNVIKQITLDFQARRSNLVTAFDDGKFNHLKDWMRSKLHIYLDTCTADSHVPRAKNAIIFVKKNSGL